MTHAHRFGALFLSLALLAACDGQAHHHINGAVTIAPGEQTGEVATVNGGVQIGAKASVADVRSVNGSQSLGEGAQAGSMRAVNGAIRIAAQAVVRGSVKTVNGALSLAPGAQVEGALTNVNGSIGVDGAHVAGRLRTVNGSITVLNGASVDGGILVEKPQGFLNPGFFNGNSASPPRVVIGRDVSIGGTLRFEREVRLYVSDQVRHLGPIEGATPVRYSGDTPPE